MIDRMLTRLKREQRKAVTALEAELIQALRDGNFHFEKPILKELAATKSLARLVHKRNP